MPDAALAKELRRRPPECRWLMRHAANELINPEREARLATAP
jgi:hypothetical protein